MNSANEINKLNFIHRKASDAISYCQGQKPQDFTDDRLFSGATQMCFVFISNACKALSPEVREGNPQVNWLAMAKRGDALIEKYWDVDFDDLWRAVHHELPPFIKRIEAITSSLETEYGPKN